MKNIIKSFFNSKNDQKDQPDRKIIDNKKNSVRLIYPYKTMLTWSFDDPSVGLVREPFVSGTESIIDHVIKSFKSKKPIKHFSLYFSDKPFPDHMYVLDWLEPANGGNWYRFRSTKMDGWLCPALYKYFDKAPQSLYIKIEL